MIQIRCMINSIYTVKTLNLSHLWVIGVDHFGQQDNDQQWQNHHHNLQVEKKTFQTWDSESYEGNSSHI